MATRTTTRLGLLRATALALCLHAASLPAFAADRVRAVATFSILGDLVRQVGGDAVAGVSEAIRHRERLPRWGNRCPGSIASGVTTGSSVRWK